MPSPIAHSLAGLAIAFVAFRPGTDDRRERVRFTAALVFTANAPDLDFAAGALTSDINAFHGGPSHSIVAALAAAAVGALLLGRGAAERRRAGLALLLAYLSHIALDVLCELPGHPNRLAVLWPFTSERWTAPFHVFAGILHGGPGADFAKFLREVFSIHNAIAIAIEVALLGPVALLAWRLRPRIPRVGPVDPSQ
jgi:inner membrane protein